MENREYGFETLALHGGSTVDPVTRSRVEPVHRTTSFLFDDAQHASDLFDLKTPGYIYTRIGNPTQEALEKRLALLENGTGALALASGTAAVFYSVINLARQGDSIVSSDKLYGGTYTMFDKILPDYGIRTRFVKTLKPEDFAAAIDSTSKAVYVETLGNPGLDLADIPAIAKVAHEHGIPLIVDSTFTTPYLMRPLDLGADIVVHSITKWIGGHGTAIGGAVIESGRFDWANGNFPMFTEPDASYHGLRWAYDLGDLSPQVFTTRMRTGALRNLGASISPDNAWLFLQGIETLPLRMERHCENAQAVAEYLSRHPAAAWVRYPGLPEDPSHGLAKRLLKKGFGGMVVFSLKGGRAAGASFIENLSLFSHLANVGDAKSLAIHPASTTHSQLSEEQQRAAGVDPGMVRLSIGIEHIDDIIADLETACAV